MKPADNTLLQFVWCWWVCVPHPYRKSLYSSITLFPNTSMKENSHCFQLIQKSFELFQSRIEKFVKWSVVSFVIEWKDQKWQTFRQKSYLLETLVLEMPNTVSLSKKSSSFIFRRRFPEPSTVPAVWKQFPLFFNEEIIVACFCSRFPYTHWTPLWETTWASNINKILSAMDGKYSELWRNHQSPLMEARCVCVTVLIGGQWTIPIPTTLSRKGCSFMIIHPPGEAALV